MTILPFGLYTLMLRIAIRKIGNASCHGAGTVTTKRIAASELQKDTVTANAPTQGARGAKKFAQQTNGVKSILSEFEEKSNPCSQFSCGWTETGMFWVQYRSSCGTGTTNRPTRARAGRNEGTDKAKATGNSGGFSYRLTSRRITRPRRTVGWFGCERSGRGRRTRTLNKGFGDPRVTITPCPYDRWST